MASISINCQRFLLVMAPSFSAFLMAFVMVAADSAGMALLPKIFVSYVHSSSPLKPTSSIFSVTLSIMEWMAAPTLRMSENFW